MAKQMGKHTGASTASKLRQSNDELVEPSTGESAPEDNHFSQLTNEWLIKNKMSTNMNYPDIVEQAAVGLEEEGRLLGKKEGVGLADLLRTVKYGEKKKIILCCIRIYTKESFVYRTLNKALREGDMTKVDTFGPYCYFLNCYPEALGRDYCVGTVYRGLNLEPDIIETYEQAVGQWKSWPAFTTTMKSRSVAEQFGNVLFIIELTASTRYGKAVDISAASDFPYEAEVLMLPGSNFRINSVEHREGKGPVFYLTVV